MSQDDAPSKNQVNKLGRRLRHGESPTDEDLNLLSQYQGSLSPLLGGALETIRATFEAVLPNETFEANTREKQLRSIVAKLQRQQTSLTNIQDLVGARLIVPRALDQDELVRQLPTDTTWKITDRRHRPSHGYRAIHLIKIEGGKAVEIQVRTQLQHQWAELSEQWDRITPGVKYGQGPERVLKTLQDYSNLVALSENADVDFSRTMEMHRQHMHEQHTSLTYMLTQAIQNVRRELDR